MTLNLTFLGAAGSVTGSSYLVETDTTRFLVDCGLFQGDRKLEDLNHTEFTFDPKSIDFVILTHAHLDHVGLLPKLTKEGFRGAIYSTPPTKDLSKLILTDAAQIQENGVKFDDIEALFSPQDVTTCISLFKAYPYAQSFRPNQSVRVAFQDAGHILGAAMVEVWVDGKKIVFSGDLGNYPVPIMRDPAMISDANYVICESTYGDRLHPSMVSRTKELLAAVKFARQNHAKVIIPSFALERSQELIYTFNNLYDQNLLGEIPVILDSPLASGITKVYKKYTSYFDEEFQGWLARDPDLFNFKTFRETPERDQSITLNDLHGAAVFIAGSGMADAGRVQHHLLHQLSNPLNQIIFVGFCAPGTLGRKLIEGAKRVRIKDHSVTVRAQIKVIGSFSAHADQKGLLTWIKSFKTKPQVFLTHGEDTARLALQSEIQSKLKLQVTLPKLGQRFTL